MEHNGYIEVPICIGFDSNNIVGSARLLKSAIPALPDWVLSLGVRILDINNKYELKMLGVIPDTEYAQYLEHHRNVTNVS